MHRFHVPPDQARGGDIRLSREESRHALKVLRLRPGDMAEVLDGCGTVIRCELTGGDHREARLKVLHRTLQPPDPFRITLIQAVTKGKAMDMILQKAVELGVHRMVPVIAGRTVAVVDDDRSEDKREKWHAVLVEAMKQSGNPWLPDLVAPVPFAGALNLVDGAGLHVVASLQRDAVHLHGAFKDFQSKQGVSPASVSVWIGPEGDFTDEENHRLAAAGAVPVSLGRNVLRSETAAITALAVVRHELTRLA